MAQGTPYLEFVVFANYDCGLDVYQCSSAWDVDVWSMYQIGGMADPNLWRAAATMRWVKNVVRPDEDMQAAIPTAIDLFAAQRH